MSETTSTLDIEEPALPPEEPSLPPGEWARKNLFSSVGNSTLTILFSLFVLYAFRVMANFIFENPERDWVSIKYNMRLFFAFAYPVTQFVRVWVALGVLLALVGLSAGLWPSSGRVSAKRISTWFMASGFIIAFGGLLVKGSLQYQADGQLVYDEELEVIRDAWASSLGDRTIWFGLAAVLFLIGASLWFGLGERRRYIFLHNTHVMYTGLGVAVASLWVVKYGHYAANAEGVPTLDPDSIVAFSTRMPLTVMWVLIGVSYQVGRRLRSFDIAKMLVTAGWFLSPFVTFWVILRDPDIDYAHVASTDLPMALGFALIGGAIIYALTRPSIGELGRILAFGLVIVALLTFVSAFFGWIAMLQKARISFVLLALFALGANNFASDTRTRRSYLGAWIVTIAISHYFITLINSPSTLEIRSDMFLGGFMFTMFAAIFGLLFSFPLGVVLALARTSSLPIFRLLATWFIEFVRGIPFITVLFFFDIMLPLFLPDGMDAPDMAVTILGLVLFSAAYLAENVRGGLQSIRRGQYEAADALGLTTVQRTGFIVLPQALRVSIPPLVGQAIASFKETSLFAIIGIFDFLRVANSVIPNQSTGVNFVGHKLEGLLFVSFIYWIGSFTMSKYSQSLETKLGVGER